jgi:hypothetical protein
MPCFVLCCYQKNFLGQAFGSYLVRRDQEEDHGWRSPEQKVSKTASQVIVEHSEACLSSQLHKKHK